MIVNILSDTKTLPMATAPTIIMCCGGELNGGRGVSEWDFQSSS